MLLAFRPGDTNPLASRVDVAGVEDAVRSNVAVVVAAKGSGDITRAGNLAFVPFGSGEIVVRRREGRRAEVFSHYFDGTVVKDQSTIDNGGLKLTARARSVSQSPLEWIEVRIR